MRPTGSAAELEARRVKAIRLLGEGRSLSQVARMVSASVSSVKRWKDAIARGGHSALKAKRHPGRIPRLAPSQRIYLLEILRRGASRAGFSTDRWTCRRVAEVIRRQFGITYHRDYVGTLLRKLGWVPRRHDGPSESGRGTCYHWHPAHEINGPS